MEILEDSQSWAANGTMFDSNTKDFGERSWNTSNFIYVPNYDPIDIGYQGIH